ncbi:uncharacterized protein LOC119989533 [Tripterygium wilfordii]|uniref:uncharacterized protein LOC119989533 n=1 Tax=Tripterygium wilfordii TaxID=458696 RepID=UPI0018F7ED68|nr:uncharacterized protein LOC119989533 [Tripterygium wilfordii]
MNRHIWLTRRSRINRKLEVKIRAGIKRLRQEMAEISEEQKCIREGKREVREKFGKIKADREQFRKETISTQMQNAAIQVCIGLMFGIVKARAQNNYDLAAQLTQSLRDLMANQNDQNALKNSAAKKLGVTRRTNYIN